MTIETPRPDMKISVTDAEVTVNWDPPAITKIDMDDYFNEGGLKKPRVLTVDRRDLAHKATLDSIARISVDGDHLGATEKGGNRVASHAKQKTIAPPTVTINIKAFPTHTPNMSWEVSSPEIDVTPYSVNVDVTGDYMPNITLDGSFFVEVYLQNKPYISITVAEQVEAAMDPYRTSRAVDVAV
jgi:hypothetical protein